MAYSVASNDDPQYQYLRHNQAIDFDPMIA
jgi:hypothetical protein